MVWAVWVVPGVQFSVGGRSGKEGVWGEWEGPKECLMSGFLHLRDGRWVGVRDYVDVRLRVCSSVWVAARGCVLGLHKAVCLCMCVRVGWEPPGQSRDCAQACPAPRCRPP